MLTSMSFDDDAKDAIGEAADATRALGHRTVDTEHLLLGCIRALPEHFRPRCDPGALEEILLGLAPEQVPEEVPAPRELPLSPAAVRTLELAVTEARDRGAADVGIHHLVIGMIRQDTCAAARALRQLGLGEPGAWEPPSA
jgi:ATP-dependent Clp protease ATP-binding subunit ClpC